MKTFVHTMLAVGATIVLVGVLLDEAGRGKLGSFLQSLAVKATRGYGVGA